MRNLCRLAPFALFLVGVAVETAAQIPLGREFTVNSRPADLGESEPREVTMTPDGRFVVAIDDDTSEYAVYARPFDARGVALTPQLLASSDTAFTKRQPSIASDVAGNFVVVWNSNEQDGSVDGVFGQRFAAAGSRRGAEFRVNQTTYGPQTTPAVAMRADGAFVVVWAGPAAHGRRYDASGLPIGGEFQVSQATIGPRDPSVDFDAAGNFVVVWSQVGEIRGRRFSAGGVPIGSEFLANTVIPAAGNPDVASADDGSFAVAWSGYGAGDMNGVFLRRFDANGVPSGSEVLVNSYTTGAQLCVAIDADADGDVVVAWQSYAQDGDGSGIFARRLGAGGVSGPEFRVNTYTTSDQAYPSVASDKAGNFIVTWHSSFELRAQRYAGGLIGTALAVDSVAQPSSDGNGVLEAGETVVVSPSWLNGDFFARTATGTASAFTGPAGGNPIYTVVDGGAAYGSLGPGATASCAAMNDCYRVSVSVPSVRPAPHWDATLREDLSPASLGALHNWAVHVGDSFSDVPRSNSFYRFVEALLHRNVTAGCAGTLYCPASPTTRAQMAVFVLVAKEGGYQPPPCGSPRFLDVPASSPFCAWIEELARRGVVSGCGGGNYCPGSAVTREQMSVFVLLTLDPAINPPACGTPMFTDVPASSPFCRWIEDLARRGVVTGCGSGLYCPASPVTREQMGAFLSVTFGLTLYGP